MAILAVLAVIYFKFWWRLPSRTRTLFLVSAAIYVGGAIGVEMLGGWYFAQYFIDYTYSMLVLVEETMEIIGSSLFIYTLCD